MLRVRWAGARTRRIRRLKVEENPQHSANPFERNGVYAAEARDGASSGHRTHMLHLGVGCCGEAVRAVGLNLHPPWVVARSSRQRAKESERTGHAGIADHDGRTDEGRLRADWIPEVDEPDLACFHDAGGRRRSTALAASQSARSGSSSWSASRQRCQNSDSR